MKGAPHLRLFVMRGPCATVLQCGLYGTFGEKSLYNFIQSSFGSKASEKTLCPLQMLVLFLKAFLKSAFFFKFKALWFENDTVEGLGINICKSTPTSKASLNPHPPPPQKKEKEKERKSSPYFKMLNIHEPGSIQNTLFC